MLYALSHPLALLGLVLGFVAAVTLHGAVQAFVATRTGDRRPRAEGRVSLDTRRHLDPFGCVAAGLAGPGWVRPVEVGSPVFRGRAPWRPVLVLATGPLASGLLGLGLLVGARAAGASEFGIRALPLSELLHGRGQGAAAGASLLLLEAGAAALAVALLALVPLPPLDAGRALFSVAPRSQGWQRARHWLIEQNIGLVAVLVLLIIPIAGERPLLLVLLDTLARPLLDAIAGLAL